VTEKRIYEIVSQTLYCLGFYSSCPDFNTKECRHTEVKVNLHKYESNMAYVGVETTLGVSFTLALYGYDNFPTGERTPEP
jgi:hypothetical protein